MNYTTKVKKVVKEKLHFNMTEIEVMREDVEKYKYLVEDDNEGGDIVCSGKLSTK